jgi:hypothetical protein
MSIDEVFTAPRAPWQNPFVERFIGSARRDCFDHVIVFNGAGLLRLMARYGSYYERSRTHLASDKDTLSLLNSPFLLRPLMLQPATDTLLR